MLPFPSLPPSTSLSTPLPPSPSGFYSIGVLWSTPRVHPSEGLLPSCDFPLLPFLLSSGSPSFLPPSLDFFVLLSTLKLPHTPSFLPSFPCLAPSDCRLPVPTPAAYPLGGLRGGRFGGLLTSPACIQGSLLLTHTCCQPPPSFELSLACSGLLLSSHIHTCHIVMKVIHPSFNNSLLFPFPGSHPSSGGLCGGPSSRPCGSLPSPLVDISVSVAVAVGDGNALR